MAVSAYGVMMYADGIMCPVLYGMCDSIQPAVGYNYGAKNYGRVAEIERRCFGVCGVLSVLMAGIMLWQKELMVSIFVKKEEVALIAMSLNALTFFSFTYLTRWISMAVQSYLSAIGKAGYSAIISITMAFIAPMAVLGSLYPMKLTGLWLNPPITALIVASLSLVLLKLHLTKEKAALKELEGAEALKG